MARNGDSHDGLVEAELQIRDGLNESDDSRKPHHDEKRQEFFDRDREFLLQRKAVRDGLRSFFERTPALKGIFGARHVPPIDVEVIEREENDRALYQRIKAAGRVGGFHYLPPEDPNKSILDKPGNIMKAEELGKFVVEKFAHLLQAKNYDEWSKSMLKYANRFDSKEAQDAFYDIVKMAAEEEFAAALESGGRARIISAFMRLGTIRKFQKEDLINVSEAVLENPNIKKILLDIVHDFLRRNVEEFFALRNHLVELGFFSHAEIDTDPKIQELLHEHVQIAFNKKQIGVLFYVLDHYGKNQVHFQLSEAEQQLYCEKALQKARLAAKKSPGDYRILREEFEKHAVVDVEVMDRDEVVRWYLLGHARKWEEVHPWALSKMRMWWREIGLDVMDNVRFEEFDAHPNKYLRVDPKNFTKIGRVSIDPNQKAEVVAQQALHYVTAEKEDYEEKKQYFKQDNDVIQADYAEILAKWYLQYPQYNPKNEGRGYRQTSEI